MTMVTDEENTRWVGVWAVNDPDHYDHLVATASDGPDALRELVYDLWTNAPRDSVMGTQAREMTESDYDRVDWAEVASTLLSE